MKIHKVHIKRIREKVSRTTFGSNSLGIGGMQKYEIPNIKLLFMYFRHKIVKYDTFREERLCLRI